MVKLPKIRTQNGSSLPMILIILALVSGFLFYFQIIKPGQVNEYEIMPEIQSEIIRFRGFKSLNLNFALFEIPDFRNLRIFGEVPVQPGPGGKQDLFSP